MPGLTTPTDTTAAETKASRSICAAGTPLNGLNFIKGKTDPVALADEEYPEWLWDCLEVQKKDSDAAEDDAGDEFCESFPPSLQLFSLLQRLTSNHLVQPNPRNSDD
jgi:large subunit ribosomal protein L54